ncbi:MAG TPA: outer membrane protein transport protein [Kofleriaceae bacterium]|nr:outer membrane protein transport protein [Kofleriaceae bacterium]
MVQPASAGGLFIPGTGAISTSRAGAAVASTDDGEAMSINPAGFAKAEGLKLTISATLVQYFMSFSRRGTYDPVTNPDNTTRPYNGDAYATVENDPNPPLGIGKFQPLPVLAVSWDLGGRVPGLVIAGGLYTPSGYPFRDMSQGYDFERDVGNDSIAPPPTRYDVMSQESAALFPSIAAAYRITPDLDVGVRFTAGNLKTKTSVVVWGTPANVDEDIRNDSIFTADVSDPFIPTGGLGALYRIGPSIELGANFTAPVVIKAKGTARSFKGPSTDQAKIIGPVPDAMARCATGGTFEEQKACISLQLPMTATVGGRYKILDDAGQQIADVELDVDGANWGKTCNFDSEHIVSSSCTSPGQYRVQIDSGLYNAATMTFAQPLQTNAVKLGLQDTFGVRLGGSYRIPVAANNVTVRGGYAYDTAAAKPGWLRANFDGAARHTIALGGAYEASSWQLSAGFGYIHEGTNTNPGASPDGSDCNPTSTGFGCAGDGIERPVEDRQGPDPTSPLIPADNQTESPYNQGSIKSHYLMFMIGFSKGW